MPVATFLMIFGARMDILFIVKVKILWVIKWASFTLESSEFVFDNISKDLW